jgi:peptidoglycan/xylan/chitin deacetylase (PgdA/CDA1 family)
MKKAWYILNYHNISWEENAFLRPLGGSFPPDIFREHVRALNNHFRLTGVNEAYNLFKNGNIQEPLLSFWFDDGYTDVRKYALPILEEFKVDAAISINSSLMLKEESFWRFELAWLRHRDKISYFKNELKQAGILVPTNSSMREFTLGGFSQELRAILHRVYHENSTPETQKVCKEIYDGVNGLKILGEKGWHLANHTASHYPVSEEGLLDMLVPEFVKCDNAMRDAFGKESDFWVLPFDRKPAKELIPYFNQTMGETSKVLVHVRNKLNFNGGDPKHVYRIYIPDCGAKNLIRHLKKF